MVVFEFREIELDYCDECLGVWFDDGEVELLIESAGLDPREAKLDLEPAGERTSEAPRPCPLCRKKMEKVTPAGTEGRVILDRCHKAGGIWFDSKEIVEALRSLSEVSGEQKETVRILTEFLNDTLSGEKDRS